MVRQLRHNKKLFLQNENQKKRFKTKVRSKVNKKIASKKYERSIDIFCFVSDSKMEVIQDLKGVGSKGKKDARKVLMEHCENKAVTENPHPKEDSFVTNDNDSMNVETRVLDDLEVPLDPLDNIIEGNLGFDEEVLTVEEREAFLYGARVNSEYVVEDEFLSSHNQVDEVNINVPNEKADETSVQKGCTETESNSTIEDEILLLDDYEILHVDDDIYGFRVETKHEPQDQESDLYFSDEVSEVASIEPSIQLDTVELKTLSGKCMSVNRS